MPLGFFPISGAALSGLATPAPAPVRPGAGQGKPFVTRDPDAPKRSRQHDDVVAAVLNSLLRQGVLVQTGAQSYQLQGAGGVPAARNPNSADDATLGFQRGSLWVNTLTGGVWVCRDPAPGAAVWAFVV